MKKLPRNCTEDSLAAECRRLNAGKPLVLELDWQTALCMFTLCNLGMRCPDSGGAAWDTTQELVKAAAEAIAARSALLSQFLLASVPDFPGDQAPVS